jgi:hypothetical protein
MVAMAVLVMCSVHVVCVYRASRQTGKEGRWVAIYVKNSFSVALNADLTSTNFEESLWCTVKCEKVSVLVGVIYRAPSSNKLNNTYLMDVLRAAVRCCSNRKLLIMGDFNYPNINYNDSTLSAGHEAAPGIFSDYTGPVRHSTDKGAKR